MSPLDSSKLIPIASGPIPLSPTENLFCSIYDAFDGAAVGVTVMGVRGRIEAETLRAALRNLQIRHPKLRARIIKSADGRRCYELPSEPSPIPVDFKDYETDTLPWQEELDRLMRTTLDPTVEPLCRVLVLRSRTRLWCYLIILVHHGIADGLSSCSLIADLLKYYEDVEKHGRSSPVSSLPIVVAGQARSTGNWVARFTLLPRVIRERRAIRKEMWTSLPHDDQESPHPLCVYQVFSKQQTLTLVRRCRKEKTTVYGALVAAALCGLVALLPQQYGRFKCRVPIDIREKLEGPKGRVTEEDLGCFISMYENIYAVDEHTGFWDLARHVDRDVKTFIAAGGATLYYNLARFYKFHTSKKTHKRGTLHVGNYGVVGFRDRYGSLNLEECSILFNSAPGGPSLSLVAVTIQQRMNLTLVIAELSEDFREGLVKEILGQLQRAIDDPVF